MFLRHIHLPGLTPYILASKVQDKLVRSFLAHKASPKDILSPEPTILTAQFQPVYTCGRREVGNITAQQKSFLTEETLWGKADFHEALRGGQTTFHGPGQLVAYPIIDLKRHGLSARCYVHALESAVIAACKHYGVSTGRTENPGVWTSDGEKKICALGVHLRRNVSSHGIGLNVSTELGWFGRIVACGLEGKGTTSLLEQGAKGLEVDEVGDVFVKSLAESLEGIETVVKTDEREMELD